MNYFQPDEFDGWWDLLHPTLKQKLDDFRHAWGSPVFISRASGAVGRHLGPLNTSQHNVDRWGQVRAVDVMPEKMKGRGGAEYAVRLAEEVGFTGIGFYPHWRPLPGLHLDIRGGKLATWGGVRDKDGKQIYVAMTDALEEAGV